MTSSTDFDRRLAAFLDEGPTRPPDGPLDGALAHAMAHPRRPDPLRAVRRDPMGSPWFAGTGGMRALPLVAAIGLLLVAALAAASVGGWFDRDPGIVVPSPSAAPSEAPSGSPTPTAPTSLRVDLVEVNGADAEIEIIDGSSTLVGAMSGQPADGGSVADGVEVAPVDGDPNKVQLTWTVMTCETLHQLVIEPDGRTMTLSVPSCEGDTFPRDLILILEFDAPVDSATIAVTRTPAE